MFGGFAKLSYLCNRKRETSSPTREPLRYPPFFEA